MTTVLKTAITIAELNDRFRKGELGLGTKVLTSSVKALSKEQQLRLIGLVKDFDAFTPGNDPHGERDFGSIEMDEKTFFWKIDYYDSNYEYGSEDPSDPTQTRRVMTIMHSSEY